MRGPPTSTRPDTLLPYPALVRCPRSPPAASRWTARKSCRVPHRRASRPSGVAAPRRLVVRALAAGARRAAHQAAAELAEQRLDEVQPALAHRGPALDHRLHHVWGNALCHQLLDTVQINLVQRLKVGQAEQAPRLFRRAIDLDMELHRSPFALRRLSRAGDRKSTRLNSSNECAPRIPHTACKK